ncbi:hypothetical protein V5O48_015186, partial [Marasmius crinis-equi]
EPESEHSEDRNLPSDEQILAQYEQHSESSDSGRESDIDRPLSPYGGSQYTSDDPDERVGFMRDSGPSDSESECEEYTLSNERIAAAREDPSSESDTESHYESCDSDESEPDNRNDLLRLNFTEYFRSISEQPDGGFTASVEPKPVKFPNVGRRPERTAAQKRCLAAWVELNGLKAFVLFDSGSTADVIGPDFARVAKMKIYRLENPVTLQLGTKGSRSRITSGCMTKYTISSSKDTVVGRDYFDIANVDRYDAVVGTVFMRRHGIALDFRDDTVKMNGSVVPTLSEGEELAELVRRSSKRISENIALKDNEEIEVIPRPQKNKHRETKHQVVILPDSKGRLTSKPTSKPSDKRKD